MFADAAEGVRYLLSYRNLGDVCNQGSWSSGRSTQVPGAHGPVPSAQHTGAHAHGPQMRDLPHCFPLNTTTQHCNLRIPLAEFSL